MSTKKVDRRQLEIMLGQAFNRAHEEAIRVYSQPHDIDNHVSARAPKILKSLLEFREKVLE